MLEEVSTDFFLNVIYRLFSVSLKRLGTFLSDFFLKAITTFTTDFLLLLHWKN